ncbi:MAG: hypothetical protein ACI3XS_04065 [Eubacteriales bacterium]
MKTRRILSILSIVLIVCAFTSCSGKGDVPKGMKLASDTSIVDYSLFVPEEWMIVTRNGATSVQVSKTDCSSVSVAQWNLTDEISSIDAWWEDYKEQMNNIFAEMTVVTEGEKTVVDGKAASKYIYYGTFNGVKYTYMVVATIRNNSIYVITYTSMGEVDDEKDLFAKNLGTVNSIIENFRFN